VFKGLSNLLVITLTGQFRITNIDANLFQDVPSLQTLQIYGNNLTTLSVNTFANLKNLRTLYLTNNKITTIDSSLFQDLTSLWYIFLSYNKITTIKANTFVNHVELKILDLSHNPLLTIESGAFYNFHLNLVYINLNSTQLDLSLDHSLFSASNIKSQGNFAIYFWDNAWSSSDSNLCDQNPNCIMKP
jgi:Leucine-rich repeat (LRR) protein